MSTAMLPTLAEPLSHGQLYSWREIESYPPWALAEANLPATVDLRGTTQAEVRAALRRLVARHEVLRTTYHRPTGTDGVPVQRVHDDVEPPVAWVDRPVRGPQDAEVATRELLGLPLGPVDALCWRGTVVCSGGRPMFAALSFSHLILDVWSVQALHRQLDQLLADPGGTPPTPGPTPRALGATERADTGRRRREAAEAYWDQALAGPGWDTLPTCPSRVGSARVQSILHSAELGAAAAAAARRHGVTVPAVLLGALAVGLARGTGQEHLPMAVMASNRFRPAVRDVVGTLNQLVPVPVRVEATAGLDEHVRRVAWACATAYRHGGYDVDRVGALARRDHPATGSGGFTDLFPAWFNYLALDDTPPLRRSRAAVEEVARPRAFGQPVDVRVTLQAGVTSVALRTDPDLLDPAAVAVVLRTCAVAVAALAGPGVPRVGAVRAGATLPPGLFPPGALPT